MATDTPFPTSPAETAQPDAARSAPMTDAARNAPLSDAARSAPISDTDLRKPLADDYGLRSPSFDDAGTRSADSAARTLGAGTDDLIGRIAQTAHETIDRLADTAAPHVNRLQESLSGDALHQRADEMRELRDEWTESLRCTVRDNPLAAVGVALAVGVLIARLSR